MKEFSVALSHGLGWLEQAHAILGMDQEISPAKIALSVLSMANTNVPRPIKIRKLEQAFGGEDALIDDLLAGSGAVGFAELAECGVDVGKVIGGLIGGGDLPELTPDGYDIPQDFLMMFADDGEVDCSEDQEKKFASAVSELLSCTGWGRIMDENKEPPDELAAQLDEACDSVQSPLSPFGFDPPSESLVAEQCIDFVLGDNSIGDLLRNIYRLPDRNCQCLIEFGDAVPSCLIQALDDNVGVPGSLFKKAACLTERACGFLDDMCRAEMDGLDRCLPDLKDSMPPSCETVFEKCFETGVISVDLPSRLTEGKLPDACVNVSKKDDQQFADGQVVKRYAHFYDNCIGERESDAADFAVNSIGAGNGELGSESAGGGQGVGGSKKNVLLFALVAAAIATAAFALLANEKFRVRRHFTPIKDCDPEQLESKEEASQS